MIEAFCLAVVVGLFWVFDKVLALRRELKVSKAKESHADAKKIVDTKSDSDLVADFNKRYPGPDSGSGGEPPKGSSG